MFSPARSRIWEVVYMGHVQAVCRACGQKKPVEGFVMSLEAQKMVCFECAKSMKKSQSKPFAGTLAKEVKPRLRKEYVPDKDDVLIEQMARRKEKAVKAGSYRCSRCGYLFLPSSGRSYVMCPFCKTSITDKV